MSAAVSYDPRTGRPHGEVADTTPDEVERVLGLAAAAAPAVAQASPATRAGWLRVIATPSRSRPPHGGRRAGRPGDRPRRPEAHRRARPHGRTASLLRHRGRGGFMAGGDGRPPGQRDRARAGACAPRPGRRLWREQLPLAFGVLGNDTASALAAGCPVIAKAHPAHPALSQSLAEVARAALARAGAPDNTFGLVAGFEAGTAMVTSRHTAAVAFTGSQRGGLALWRIACGRDVVIPVFAEMGTVNPVVVTPGGAQRLQDVAPASWAPSPWARVSTAPSPAFSSRLRAPAQPRLWGEALNAARAAGLGAHRADRP